MNLASGTTLERYVIDKAIGQGGFGITYLAQHARLQTQVVIKEFFPNQLVWRASDGVHVEARPEFDEEARHFLDSFEKEAQLLATFSHHNIVRVTDVFEANDTAYIVMAYEHGQTLEQKFRAGLMRGEEELRALLDALLDALSVLHERGVIHRDIKGDNIIVRDDGSPVLIDFGSARVAHGVATQTVTALVTPGYAPIEQFDADSSRLGPWTDIYALGATLYRAITDRPPARAFERSSTIADQRPDPYAGLLAEAWPDYSPVFLAAVNESLAFSPQYRPQSTAEWRALLAGATRPDADTRVAALQRPASRGTAPAAAAAGSATPAADGMLSADAPTVAADTAPAAGGATTRVPDDVATEVPLAPQPALRPAAATPPATPARAGGSRTGLYVGVAGLLLGAAGVGLWLMQDGAPSRALPAVQVAGGDAGGPSSVTGLEAPAAQVAHADPVASRPPPTTAAAAPAPVPSASMEVAAASSTESASAPLALSITPPAGAAADPAPSAAGPRAAQGSASLASSATAPAPEAAAPLPAQAAIAGASGAAPAVASAEVTSAASAKSSLRASVPAPAPALAAATPPPPATDSAAEVAQLRTLLADWASAWEDNTRSVDGYAGFYDPGFQARGMDRSAWLADKRDKGQRTTCIDVDMDDIELTVSGDRAVVQFMQTYRSDRYCDTGEKTLVMRRGADGWRVVSEEQPEYRRCTDFCKAR